ncbi:MFS transporter [Streptomyces atratus]|uniref:MFS transporter n=1 Tax=Streptomyces atratus TaxID=1893 RepID=UPI0036686351
MALKDETSIAASTVTSTGPTPAGRPFRLGPLYFTVPLGNFVLYALWTVVPGFLLPIKVQQLTGTTDVGALGLASTLGAVTATLGNPAFGQFSDRTRSRFGRRTPWLVACALLGAVALLLQSAASTIALLGLTYGATSLVINGFQAALTAIVPDRFPERKLGLASSLMGVGLNTGVLAGSLLFTFYPSFAGPSGYYLMAGLVVATAFAVAIISPDQDSRELPHEPFKLGAFLRGFWISPRQYPDFAWVFLARAALMLGYFLTMAFGYYALQEYVGMSADAAISASGTLSAASAVASIVGATVTAPLADRSNRLKVFVLVSGIGVALSLMIPLLSRSYTDMMIFNIANGFAFGVYMAVDTAMVNRVLPHAEDAAKDLGIMNMASAFPQVLSASLGALVVTTMGYRGLFAVSAVIALIGACAVLPVRKLR